MTATFSEARQTISQAITAMEKAEDFATGSQQLKLLDIIEDLRKERMRIDADNLMKSNKTYTALTGNMKEAKGKLDKLTSDIKALIRAAEQAAQVAGALTRIIQLAASIA
jgi:hypothetical protein